MKNSVTRVNASTTSSKMEVHGKEVKLGFSLFIFVLFFIYTVNKDYKKRK